MKSRTKNIIFCSFFGLSLLQNANAQVQTTAQQNNAIMPPIFIPNPIAGHSLYINITDSKSPFTTNGIYLLLINQIGNSYQLIGLNNITYAQGTCSYNPTTQTFSFFDKQIGQQTVSINWDNKTIKFTTLTNGYQTGNFTLFSNPPPSNLNNKTISCSILSGNGIYANTGNYSIKFDALSKNYSIIKTDNTKSSIGTSIYTIINSTIGCINIQDKSTGTAKIFLATQYPSHGFYAIQATNGYQTGSFSFIDTTPPNIKINTPNGNYRATNSNLKIVGTANDNTAVDSISYCINNKAWQNANGTTNWSANITLEKGTNTIEAVAKDTAGNKSTVAKTTINFIPAGILTISSTGPGYITPNLNGKLLDIGSKFILNAQPIPPNLFNAWNDRSTTPIKEFTMAQNLAISASFTTNAYIDAYGTYAGLIITQEKDNLNDISTKSGYITINISKNSVLSGFLQTTNKFIFSGKISATGNANIKLHDGLSLNLQLQSTNHNLILGSIENTNGNTEAYIQANRNTWDAKSNPTPFKGTYKLTNNTNTFGIVVVDASGNAITSGTLPDGSKVLSSTTISADGTWPLFGNNPKGYIVGWGTFSNGTVTNNTIWTHDSNIQTDLPLYGTNFTMPPIKLPPIKLTNIFELPQTP